MKKTQKVGRNEKCPCNSNKKYKKCCENKLLLEKLSMDKIYTDGHHTTSNSKLIPCIEYLKKEYSSYKIINITNNLNIDTYRAFQTKNYYEKIIMVAERLDTNNGIFSTRGPENVDIIVMYQGAYRCFQSNDLLLAASHIDKMINKNN